MNGTHPEVADVIRLAGRKFLNRFNISTHQHCILRAIARCRTAELGGHIERCRDCHFERIAYNSCRNRHCPKCQASSRARWMEARAADLLPVPYFHVVFTIPHQLSPLALQNPREVYGILFQATAETLKEVAANPKHLGARIGCLAVLHTWGQNLMHHPHLHCVIPAGGLSEDDSQWISCKKDFFLPVRVLSRVFRGKFIHLLKQAYRDGRLQFHGSLRAIASPFQFNAFLNRCVRREWVVYAKRPFGGPQQVLKYLARYTHRVAISNSRLLDCNAETVTFRWKNYAAGERQETMTLQATEFLRRFLLHTLPKGFQRIRQFGIQCNRYRKATIARCRQLLEEVDPPEPLAHETADASSTNHVSERETPPLTCPSCGSHRILVIDFPGISRRLIPHPHFWSHCLAFTSDTS